MSVARCAKTAFQYQKGYFFSEGTMNFVGSFFALKMKNFGGKIMKIAFLTYINPFSTHQAGKLINFLLNFQNQNFNTKNLTDYEIVIVNYNKGIVKELQKILEDPIFIGIPSKIITLPMENKIATCTIKKSLTNFDIIVTCSLNSTWHPDLWGTVVNELYRRKKPGQIDKNTIYYVNTYETSEDSIRQRKINNFKWKEIKNSLYLSPSNNHRLLLTHISNIVSLEIDTVTFKSSEDYSLNFVADPKKEIKYKLVEEADKMVIHRSESSKNYLKLIKDNIYEDEIGFLEESCHSA